MARTAADLITVQAAASAGLGWTDLQTLRWRRICRGVYAPAWVPPDEMLLLRAIRQRLPAEAAYSGRTAAWLYGLDVPPCSPIEVTVPAHLSVTRRAGVRLHRVQLAPSEVALHRGFRVTSRLRTVLDLVAQVDLVEGIALVDMALRAGLASEEDLLLLAEAKRGRKGAGRLARALASCDPKAESPMESRLRALLVLSGLPAPDRQVDIHDQAGSLIGRVDFLYPEARVCIEYDGDWHRGTMSEDHRRQNRIVAAGFTVLRFTAADMSAPERVVFAVAAAINQRPNSRLLQQYRRVRARQPRLLQQSRDEAETA